MKKPDGQGTTVRLFNVGGRPGGKPPALTAAKGRYTPKPPASVFSLVFFKAARSRFRSRIVRAKSTTKTALMKSVEMMVSKAMITYSLTAAISRDRHLQRQPGDPLREGH
ncbi:hypothetical protein [Shinella sumterensis]|uniref:Uncharacterized protein n=1 Tax=Shinella sumterensis TaxID=1967501 RepID=A0AA50H598_9HYPH|nr:hypothetical protein [Shinella sumterensis]WLR98699.1 hypothetical protein Q9313_06630 [Shinella sumterensis]